MIVSIYALKDPRTSEIRYIGQTRDTEKRYYSHCTGSGTNCYYRAWARELRQLQLLPVMEILELTTLEFADTREWHWIEWAVKSGLHLVNKQGMSRFR